MNESADMAARKGQSLSLGDVIKMIMMIVQIKLMYVNFKTQ